jgi:hypothetical protein
MLLSATGVARCNFQSYTIWPTATRAPVISRYHACTPYGIPRIPGIEICRHYFGVFFSPVNFTLRPVSVKRVHREWRTHDFRNVYRRMPVCRRPNRNRWKSSDVLLAGRSFRLLYTITAMTYNTATAASPVVLTVRRFVPVRRSRNRPGTHAKYEWCAYDHGPRGKRINYNYPVRVCNGRTLAVNNNDVRLGVEQRVFVMVFSTTAKDNCDVAPDVGSCAHERYNAIASRSLCKTVYDSDNLTEIYATIIR